MNEEDAPQGNILLLILVITHIHSAHQRRIFGQWVKLQDKISRDASI